jgi:hypothetical protein
MPVSIYFGYFTNHSPSNLPVTPNMSKGEQKELIKHAAMIVMYYRDYETVKAG